MLAGQFCVESVPRLRAEETFEGAVRQMVDAGQDLAVVVDTAQHPLGLLTASCLLQAAINARRERACSIGTMLTEVPETVQEDTAIGAALARMCPPNYLLVVDADGQLVGVLNRAAVLSKLGWCEDGIG